jgi:GNAT superfamily N-acetyltransferase
VYKIINSNQANRGSGNLFLAVLPGYEGRGIGAELMRRVEDWLWSEGWNDIWLTTDVDTSLRAYGFYKRQGWVDTEIKDDLRYMKKTNPNNTMQGI